MKNIKRILVILAVILIILSSLIMVPMASLASSDKLESVHSEATINNDGTVDIYQRWQYNDSLISEGTEHYINLDIDYGHPVGDEESITDYQVSRNGSEMVSQDNWDINGSLEDKANKYGVIGTSSGIELTFGITEYKDNTFEVRYKVHNIVKETTDGEKYIHWTFLPTELNPGPSAMSAEIATEDNIDFSKVYGFNYKGKAGFVNDEKDKVFAVMTSNYKEQDTLNVFALIDDKNNLIQGTNKVDMSMEEKAKEMLKGSDYDLEHFNSEHFEEVDSKGTKKPFNFFGIIKAFFAAIVAVIVFIMIGSASKGRSLMKNVSEEDKKKLKDKEFYYRDEPDEVTYSIELIRELVYTKGDSNNNIISYYISKWVSAGVFEYLREEESKFLFRTTKNVWFSVHVDDFVADSDLELDLLQLFYEITDNNDELNTLNLKKLDVDKIGKIIKKSKKVAYKELENLGYLTDESAKEEKETKNKLIWIDSIKPVLNDDGFNLVLQHAGLKNYLTQFTLINERSSKDIELWDYYFHMAALYGITEEFKQELSKMPDLSDENMNKYNRHYGASGTSILSRSISKTVNDAYNSHNSKSSSSGGGSGSSGGGSGGGTR